MSAGTKHSVVFVAFSVAIAAVLVAAFAVTNVARAADSSDKSTFGLGSVRIVLDDSESASTDDQVQNEVLVVKDSSALAVSSSRDISAGVQELSDALEARRIAEEEAARLAAEAARKAEEEAMVRAQENREAMRGYVDDALLDAVDWTVGKEAFVNEWGARIDAYYAGYPLEGYGRVFAEAAWEYGVDPRFSPAISNTESTRGMNCFRSCNAWGWMGNASWGSWEESIWAHVRGLAVGYGYTITLGGAQKYCPPTYSDWYQKTLSQFYLI